MRYLSIILFFLLGACTQVEEKPSYLKVTGITMGVIHYSITYLDNEQRNHQLGIDSLLKTFNQSLSTYVKDSEISDFNNTGKLIYRSPFFYPVLKTSQEIYQITSGAYDPTVGPLVNLWGFGPGEKQEVPDSLTIMNAMKNVGFNKLKFDTDSAHSQQEINLSFSAIAKGYAVDLVATFLERKGVDNYFVEIGGEVICKGVNPSDQTWQIGIFDPRVEEDPTKQRAAIATIRNKAVATSGNYRNFYEVDGKKYGHTISPFTGYPVQHSLLSVSVFADHCMTADAYATAFMVLGLEKAKGILEANRELEGHFIYADELGNLKTYTSDGIKSAILVE